MEGVLVREVNKPHKSRDFFKVPYRIYKKDVNWIAPLLTEQKNLLNPRSNPFFDHGEINAWIAYDNGVPVGRIVASINHAKSSKQAYLGFFECPYDQHTFDELIKASTAWLYSKGISYIEGPVNLDTSNESGALIKGNGLPASVLMNYTPAYYRELFENGGFSNAHDLLAFYADGRTVIKSEEYVEKLGRIGRYYLLDGGVDFRRLDMSDFKNEVDRIARLYNKVMTRNWGFTPLSKRDIAFLAKGLKPAVDPRLVFFVEKDGEPIGCSFSIPDMNEVLSKMNGRLFPFGFIKFLKGRKKIKNTRVVLLGMLPEYQSKGYALFLIYRTIRDIIGFGYTGAELSWISEDNNNLISLLNKFGAEHTKTYRVYSKRLA